MTDREKNVFKVWIKMIITWVAITLLIYNLLYIFSPHNIYLVHVIQFLSGSMSVLDMISQHSSTPLPRQIAQLCVIFWVFLMFPFLFFLLYIDIVGSFCRLNSYKKKNILKNFFLCFLCCPLGIFALWCLIFMDKAGDGFRSASVNVIFSDSNMSIIITFIYALVGCAFTFTCVYVPLTAVYMFNKQFHDNVNRNLKND